MNPSLGEGMILNSLDLASQEAGADVRSKLEELRIETSTNVAFLLRVAQYFQGVLRTATVIRRYFHGDGCRRYLTDSLRKWSGGR
jgi:hypothetical protein